MIGNDNLKISDSTFNRLISIKCKQSINRLFSPKKESTVPSSLKFFSITREIMNIHNTANAQLIISIKPFPKLQFTNPISL